MRSRFPNKWRSLTLGLECVNRQEYFSRKNVEGIRRTSSRRGVIKVQMGEFSVAGTH